MVLQVNQLDIYRALDHRHLVRNLNFHIDAGEMLGVIGESGSGKSLTNLALLGLLPKSLNMKASKLQFKNIDLLSSTKKQWQTFRRNEISIIFQDPKNCLNPSLPIKTQLFESIKARFPEFSQKNLKSTALEWLQRVELGDDNDLLEAKPNELSGGMAQRLMIAIALAKQPSFLIADEITTAIDPLCQQQIMRLLIQLKNQLNLTILFVSHDLQLIKTYTQRVNVMYHGVLVESGTTQSVFNTPKHPYTKSLLRV